MKWLLLTSGALMLLVATAAAQERRTAWYIDRERPWGACIGEPRSPECAVATWQACLGAQKAELCKIAGLEGIAFRSEPGPVSFIVVMRSLPPFEGELAERVRRFDFAAAGSVEILVETSVCDESGSCSSEHLFRESVFVREIDGAWRVVGWAPELGDVVCEHERRTDPYARECDFMIGQDDYRSYLDALGRRR